MESNIDLVDNNQEWIEQSWAVTQEKLQANDLLAIVFLKENGKPVMFITDRPSALLSINRFDIDVTLDAFKAVHAPAWEYEPPVHAGTALWIFAITDDGPALVRMIKTTHHGGQA